MKVLLSVFVTLALLAPSLGVAEQAGTLEQIKASGKIRIGYRQAEPPMSFEDAEGKPIGYTIDICARIASAAKVELGLAEVAVEYVPVTAADRFTALTDNKIDILCGSTTKTLSRSKLVDFSQLTFVTGASLMSLKKTPVVSVGDLQGKKVAVIKDTTTIEALKGVLKDSVTDAEIVTVDTATDGVDALRNGQVDAFSADQVVLIGLVLTADDRDSFGISSELFSFEPFALAVRRNDADFRLVADTVLSQLYRTGQINEIYKKWFGIFSQKRPMLIEAVYRLNATPE